MSSVFIFAILARTISNLKNVELTLLSSEPVSAKKKKKKKSIAPADAVEPAASAEETPTEEIPKTPGTEKKKKKKVKTPGPETTETPATEKKKKKKKSIATA